MYNVYIKVAECTCKPGYEGTDCKEDLDSCASNPCHTGVVCTDKPPPAVEPICGDCPVDMIGDGFICGGKYTKCVTKKK